MMQTKETILNILYIFIFSYLLDKFNILNTINPILDFPSLSGSMPGKLAVDIMKPSNARNKRSKIMNKNNVTKTILPTKDIHNEPTTSLIKSTPTISSIEEQWTVVSENKKTKKSVSHPVVSHCTKNQKHAAVHTKKSNEKNTTVNSKNNSKKTNTKAHKNLKTSCKSPSSWAEVVSEQKKEQEIETMTHLLSDEMDLPALSDSESTTGTIESPCLSVRSLPEQVQTQTENSTVNNYYSLFSTGFDFSPMISKEEQHHFSSIPSAYSKAPSTHTQRQRNRSILDLLDQDQQAETTITTTSFSYFGEMMMSTSLYKTSSRLEEQWNSYPLC